METESDAKGLLMENLYKNSCFLQLEEPDSDGKAIGLCMEDQDYTEKIMELQAYLDMVSKIVRPGCSQEVLKVALNSMSSLVNILTSMSVRKPHSSL